MSLLAGAAARAWHRVSLWRYLFWASLALFLFLLVAIGPFDGKSYSYCWYCGMVKHSEERFFPFMRATIFEYSNVEHTKLSRCAARLELVPDHEHEWILCRGQGVGYSSYGGGEDMQEAVNSVRVVHLLEGLGRYGDRGAARELLKALLQCGWNDKPFMETSAALRSVPCRGFDSRASYEKWWRKHGTELQGELQRHLGARGL